MSIEKMMHIAKEDLRETLNNEQAHFMDRHVAMQTYMLAYICEKLEEKEQKSSEIEKDRRLIIAINGLYMDIRRELFKSLFAQKFPDAPKFRQNETALPEHLYTEWKLWIVGITEKQIEWAKAAKACGLIDSYIVDYDPEQEVTSEA